MKVIVLGGTRFIGRAIVEELTASGHQVLVVHRGQSEPNDLPVVEHLHVDREVLPGAAADLAAFRPDAVIDCLAMCKADARRALDALPGGLRLVVLSSMDVYRAYGGLLAGHATDALPVDEDSPVREERYPFRGQGLRGDDYEKLDVEDEYLPRRATVLRLPAVYGEHDGQRREEFILRRVRAGRKRIPVGTGSFLWSRGYVRDIAAGVRLAMETPAAAGRVYNLGEPTTASMGLWTRQILEAAGAEVELVRVPDESLPADLELTASVAQHLLVSTARATRELGFRHRPVEEAMAASVGWHLAHPPDQENPDFSSDDAALARADEASAAT